MSYDYALSDFKVGDRVELHPGTDLWMRGARYGEIVKIGQKYAHVRLDHEQVKRPVRVVAGNIQLRHRPVTPMPLIGGR